MREHDAESLTAFFRAVDARLDEALGIVVIGGSALLIAHGSSHVTTDIDLFEAPAECVEFLRRVAAETDTDISVENAGVADAPYEYADRLEEVDLGLDHLQVLVPEAHDLAIMKALRANENDLQALSEIHERKPFDLDTLVERFWEARHATGDASRLRGNFLATIDRLFGSDTGDLVEERVAGWPDPPAS